MSGPGKLAVFACEGLGKSYRRREVVRGVSFEVKAGEVVALLGPNGAGKTTCFRMAVGMLRPDRGRILLDGTDVTRLPMHRRCRLGLGYLPQEASIFRKLTVKENFLAVLEVTGCPAGEREARAAAEAGDPQAIASSPKARAVYLGESFRLD
jgi:lipopolysaccharide export system ATP-binding protein